MFENDDNCRYGNHARVNPDRPYQINGAFSTNCITCNHTNPDGTVENVLEDNAYLAHDICNENQK